MASEYVTFEDLVRFHREVILPDLDRMLDAKLDAKLDARLGVFETRMDAKLDAKLDAKFDAKLLPLATTIVRLETRMEEGFNRLHDQIIDTRREMQEGFDDLYARFDELSTDFDASKGGLRRVEQRVDRHEARIARLEKKAR
jgi:hypothetical protein